MSVALLGVAVVQTVVYLAFIRFIDLYEREPLRYVIPTFLWGFTVAVAISLVFESVLAYTITSVASARAADLVTAVAGAPVIEECAKGLALLIIFAVSYLLSRRSGAVEFSGVMDGIVYGSAVGFGFALAEDLLYYASFGPETFVMRRVFGGFAHAAFTSLTGIGIGLIPWVQNWFLKALLPLAGLAGAIFLHALFNFSATIFGPLSYVILFFVVLAYIVVIVVWLAVERRTIRSELREEVASGLLTEEEYALLPTYFRRTGRYLGLLFTGRLSDWFRERKMHNAAVDLALTKRVFRGGPSASGRTRLETLRRRITTSRPPVSGGRAP